MCSYCCIKLKLPLQGNGAMSIEMVKHNERRTTRNRKQKTENRKQKTENRKQKTENRKLKTEN